MNLIDLKIKFKETIAFMKYQKEEIAALVDTRKSSRFDKVLVSGSSQKKDTTDVVIKIMQMEKDLEYAEKEYNRLVPLINELENTYNELGERDKKIYLEYHCKGISAVKLGIKYGVSDKAIYKILKEVEKKLKK